MKTAKPRLPDIPDQLTYSLEEAAAKLRQRSLWPIRTLIDTGKLRYVQVGREYVIPHSALVAFLAESVESKKGDRS
jgi:excisionase family DNA binding protein